MKASGTVLCLVALSLVLAQADKGAIGDRCQSCIATAESFGRRVSSQYRDYIVVKDQICSQIPVVGQPACEQLLEASHAIFNKAISQPVQSCERLGACTKEEEIFTLMQDRTVGDDITCPICEYLVVYIKEQLKDPETEAQLVDQATQLCQLLPEDVQAECLQDVSAYSQQIFAFIDQSDPEEICELATMCDPSLALPQLPSSVKEQAQAALTVQDEDECNTCKLVIAQASAALADPETQKRILKYAEQQCQDFQAFQDQCEAYIELYGPLALNMARQYLSPDLCSQLGFCTASAATTLQFSA